MDTLNDDLRDVLDRSLATAKGGAAESLDVAPAELRGDCGDEDTDAPTAGHRTESPQVLMGDGSVMVDPAPVDDLVGGAEAEGVEVLLPFDAMG